MEYKKFKSGNKIPSLGLGTWKLTGDKCIEAVKNAIEIGYRHIDTAAIYGNEEEVGKAIKDFDRSQLFITSKLWITNKNYEDTIKACEESLKKLETDYLDLYLIHWPVDGATEEQLKAMNHLLKEGKIKDIGISNFSTRRMDLAQSYSEAPLVVNQVECHPLFRQDKLTEHCRKKGVILTAYSPLGRGDDVNNSIIKEVSEKYKKTPAQICLRWLLQRGNVVIPKSTSEEHLKENFNVFDFEISEIDMEKINNIQEQQRVVDPGITTWED